MEHYLQKERNQAQQDIKLSNTRSHDEFWDTRVLDNI